MPISKTSTHVSEHRLRTPRAAALAGFFFALLFATSIILLRLSIPVDPADGGAWLEEYSKNVSIALSLVPLAGIAFLWFMGVIRDRLGFLEDQFFSTIFFGSGILFLAMTFIGAAIAGSILASYAIIPDKLIDTGMYTFTRALMYRIINIYGMRMAGVFMLSLGTIWMRTQIINRYLVYMTYAFALVLLFSISLSPWAILIFPFWVFVISMYILTLNLRMRPLISADED